MCFFWQDLSDGTINFEHVNLIMTFDQILNLTVRHWTFIYMYMFHMFRPFQLCHPLILNMWHVLWSLTYVRSLWQSLSDGTINFEHMTLTVTYFLITLTLAITCVLRNKAFIFCISLPMTRSFRRNNKFWMCDHDLDIISIFNICQNVLTERDWAFICGVCPPYVQTFPTEPCILNRNFLWTLTYVCKT